MIISSKPFSKYCISVLCVGWCLDLKPKMNQWKDTDSVINSFNIIKNKYQCFFIQSDIIEIYSNISENILDTPITFAIQHTDIFYKNLRISKHCRQSLLCNSHEPWKKTYTDSCFDVKIGT